MRVDHGRGAPSRSGGAQPTDRRRPWATIATEGAAAISATAPAAHMTIADPDIPPPARVPVAAATVPGPVGAPITDLIRLDAWFNGLPLDRTRTSHLELTLAA
jgi:hypothetical protein